MKKTVSFLFLTILSLSACGKPSKSSAESSTPAVSASAGDAVDKKLQELAGAGATNCGRLQSQVPAPMDAAAKCAMQASGKKQPFYISYELPGMIIAMSGNAEGKLFTLQGSSSQAGVATVSASGACPSELRVAPSGRVTCFAPGTFGMGMDATHGGGMTKPPAAGANPHEGLGIPPPGHSNPHQPKTATPPVKQP